MSDELKSPVVVPLDFLSKIHTQSNKIKRVINTVMIGNAVIMTGYKFYKAQKAKIEYTITIESGDGIYNDIHTWLFSHVDAKNLKALGAKSWADYGDNDLSILRVDSPVGAKRVGKLRLFYDGSKTQTVFMDGHKIKVSVNKEDLKMENNRWSEIAFSNKEKITFSASSEPARQAVVEFLREIAGDKYKEETSNLYMANKLGHWDEASIEFREMSSVILPDGIAEGLIKDLETFITDESTYIKIGLPWHRGYLFYGPPGTGKTSVAKALAKHFNLDVYCISLSALRTDIDLMGLIGGIEKRSMLVLEDVDVVHAAKSRDDSESKDAVTLSGLLNALDGMATPHGLITVMTTNNKEVLDPALVRAGRVDRMEELGYIDDEQLIRLYNLVFPEAVKRRWPKINRDISHAEIVEVMKKHLNDAESAYIAIKDFVRG